MWLTFSIIVDLLPGQGIILFGTADIVSIYFYFRIVCIP